MGLTAELGALGTATEEGAVEGAVSGIMRTEEASA
jgi:hypothetical protein